MHQLSFTSPVGDLRLAEDDGALISLAWGWTPTQAETALLTEARRQLERYFQGNTSPFDLPLKPAGTAFQRRVWRLMRAIPASNTCTYGELARALGSAPRAVGGACAANPIPIIIPCHRVVAADGLGGYSGPGAEIKRALLRLEGVLP